MTIASGCDEQNRVACQVFAVDAGITAGIRVTNDITHRLKNNAVQGM